MQWAAGCPTKNSMPNRKTYITILSVAILLTVWECASLVAGSAQLLPGPLSTMKSAALILLGKDFLSTAGATVLRGIAGFAAAAAAGILLGIAGGMKSALHTLFRPWIVVIRSTPVVAVVLLAIIWLDENSVPVFIAFMTMFPIIYLNVVEGIRNVDRKNVEMACFYGIHGWKLLREVHLPAIAPFLFSGLSTAAGIGWRAVVVGEVLSLPQYGIGTAMRSAQTFLQVDVLIAWTFVTILIGAIFEWLTGVAEKNTIKWKR